MQILFILFLFIIMNYKIWKLLVLIDTKWTWLEVTMYIWNDIYLDSFTAPINGVNAMNKIELWNILYKRMSSNVYSMFSEWEKAVYSELIAEKMIMNCKENEGKSEQVNNFAIFA